jgi:hypothetical protein
MCSRQSYGTATCKGRKKNNKDLSRVKSRRESALRGCAAANRTAQQPAKERRKTAFI